MLVASTVGGHSDIITWSIIQLSCYVAFCFIIADLSTSYLPTQLEPVQARFRLNRRGATS